MPHPLLSDPWVAAKIDKAVEKYGKRWTPEQIEAFREQMAWTLATHPDVVKVMDIAHPPVGYESGERGPTGPLNAPSTEKDPWRKAGGK